jgi:hypothetical protein
MPFNPVPDYSNAGARDNEPDGIPDSFAPAWQGAGQPMLAADTARPTAQILYTNCRKFAYKIFGPSLVFWLDGRGRPQPDCLIRGFPRRNAKY